MSEALPTLPIMIPQGRRNCSATQKGHLERRRLKNRQSCFSPFGAVRATCPAGSRARSASEVASPVAYAGWVLGHAVVGGSTAGRAVSRVHAGGNRNLAT